jgi:D-glycero-D-manno-heptose 1,7-bisphosphate phosphatase
MSGARLRDRPLDTVFLDRDGTLNVPAEPGEYVRDPDRLVLLPGAAAAVRLLNEAGLLTVLVTNQRWLSRPGADHALFTATQARLTELLAAEGARLDAQYHCPHALRCCRCRKPAPGMLRRAAEDMHLDLSRAVIVGDAVVDLQAGRAAGTGTVLLSPVPIRSLLADAVCPDLAAAVDLLLQRRRSLAGDRGPARCARP